jgi:hypothetical protein
MIIPHFAKVKLFPLKHANRPTSQGGYPLIRTAANGWAEITWRLVDQLDLGIELAFRSPELRSAGKLAEVAGQAAEHLPRIDSRSDTFALDETSGVRSLRRSFPIADGFLIDALTQGKL